MTRLTETPLKRLEVPYHYRLGQQPTKTGLAIHLALQDIDFTPQARGGPHSTFRSNPLLFVRMEEYRRMKGR